MATNQPASKPRVALKAVTPGHLFLSVIIAAITAAGDSALQYVQTNGLQHFSATQLIGAVLFSFFGALGTGVVTLERNPSVQEAIDGAIAPHINALATIAAQHANIANDMTSALVWLNQQLQAQQKANQVATPAQQQVQPIQIQPQVQQTPQQSFPTVRNPQQLPAIPVVNLANQPPAQQQDFTSIRHWGDTGIVPTIGQ